MSWRIRNDNRIRLWEAARIAMQHNVLVCLEEHTGKLKTLSMAPWQKKGKAMAFRLMYLDLGVFCAMPGEGRWDVFSRLWEEARLSGALLGDKPAGDEGGH